MLFVNDILIMPQLQLRNIKCKKLHLGNELINFEQILDIKHI